MGRGSSSKKRANTVSNITMDEVEDVKASDVYSPVKSTGNDMLEFLNPEDSSKSKSKTSNKSDGVTGVILFVLLLVFLGVGAFIYFALIK